MQYVESLKKVLEQLKGFPQREGKYVFETAAGEEVLLDLGYELSELEKDIFFFEQDDEKDFYYYLENLHQNFSGEVSKGIAFLSQADIVNFITDRDGTVNNYCGRYQTSVQSAYNAVFLTRFAQRCSNHNILLTSAPLEDIGLLDISVIPEDTYIYAGSKGREYYALQGKRGRYPISDKKQEKLSELNNALKDLLSEKDKAVFGRIGSGLQFKFGQTTVARQDIYESIPRDRSQEFLQSVGELVSSIDPNGELFRIEDTGYDIEIILTVKSGDENGSMKDFDKGNGILFLDRELGLGLKSGTNLICGDTKSDIPMVEAAMQENSDSYSLFVSGDKDIQSEVSRICPNSFFVTAPDSLVTILNEISKECT
jgi:hypothetical protein